MKTKKRSDRGKKRGRGGRRRARNGTAAAALRFRWSPTSDYLHPLSPALARVMRKWRKGHRLSQYGVALRAKLSRETLAGLERGKSWFSLNVAARMCDAMGLDFLAAIVSALRGSGRLRGKKRPVY